MEQKTESLKNGIIGMLKEKGNGLTFVNLSTLPGFPGVLGAELNNQKVFFWFRCSSEAIAAISELIAEKQIKLSTTSTLAYHADGCIPVYPIGDLDRAYKTPHWCPMQIVKGENFGP
jgi:hypothetical protein